MVIGPGRDPHLYGSQPSLLEAALTVPEWVADSYPTEVSILQRYESEMQLEGFTQHAIDTVHVFRDFAEKTMNADLFRVVLLAGVAEDAQSDDPNKSRTALRTLKKYKSYVGSDTLWNYYSTIWADLPVTEAFSKQTRLSLSATGEREVLLRTAQDVEVRPLAWDNDSILTPTDRAKAFLDQVQVEAPVIKAVQAFVDLRKRRGSDRELYQKCFDVESVYAPYCAQLGLKILAPALRNEVDLIKLEKAGEKQKIYAAKELLDSLGDRDAFKNMIHQILKIATGMEGEGEFTIPDRSGHGQVFGESKLYIEGQESSVEEVDVQWRQKGLGGIAKKTRAQVPKDVVGIKLVVPERKHLAAMFAFVCQNLETNTDAIIPSPSESRDKAYHVRGRKHNLIKKVVAFLALAGYDENRRNTQFDIVDNDENKDASNYEVAKVTFLYKFVNEKGQTIYAPTELQIQTEKAELKSRVGKQGHGIYQARKCAGADGKKSARSEVLVRKSDLTEYNRRGGDMRTPGLYMNAKQSIARGAEFRKKIDHSNGRNVARIALGR